MRIEYYLSPESFQPQPGGNQFWVMQVIEIRVKCDCFGEHPACGPQYSVYAPLRLANVSDPDTVLDFLALTVGHHQCDFISMVCEAAALLAENARVVPRMYGCQVDNSALVVFEVQYRVPAMRGDGPNNLFESSFQVDPALFLKWTLLKQIMCPTSIRFIATEGNKAFGKKPPASFPDPMPIKRTPCPRCSASTAH